MLWRIPLLSAFFIGCACAQVQVPSTPATQTLRAFLDAFNGGNRPAVETLLQTYSRNYSPASTDAMLKFRNATGPLELVAIDKITPAGSQAPVSLFTKSLLKPEKANWTHLEFRVRQIASSKIAVCELDLTDSTPAQIVNLSFTGLTDLSLHFSLSF